jgi:transcriptional regulator with XRE-family HTH domain
VNAPPEKLTYDWVPERRDPKVVRAVGQKLREARKAADLSQAELGKRLRTRNGTAVAGTKIGSYERGEFLPEGRLWPQLERALGVPQAELFAPILSGLPPGEEGESILNRLERVERELADLRALVEDERSGRRVTKAAVMNGDPAGERA